MFSYFQGEKTPEPDLEQSRPQLPDNMPAVTASEKSTLTAAIDANKYQRRVGTWEFRRQLGPRDFFFRVLAMIMLYAYAYIVNPVSARGKADKAWLEVFCLLMIILFIIMHGLAY